MLKNIIKELESYGSKVVEKAKKNLTLKNKNNTGQLSNSLHYKVTQQKTKQPRIVFYGEDYGKFIDLGVQGNDPEKMPKGSKSRFNKAPNSPYQFGSGRGKKGLRKGINEWVLQRGTFEVRDDKGRFIPRKSLVFLISRSIWYTGISPSYFFRDAQTAYKNPTYRNLGNAFAKDGTDIIEHDLKSVPNINIKYGG